MKKNIFNKLLVLSFLGLSVAGCATETNSSSSKNSSPINSSVSSTSSNKISSSSSKVDTSDTSSITINSLTITGSFKQEYLVGEELDLTNVKLAVSYSDGSKETINVTTDMITPVDMNTPGFKEIVVSYKGQTTSFFINVIEEKEEDPITPNEKIDPEIVFSYDPGTVFRVGDTVKPEVTVSEGADYTTHFSCEAKQQAGETYIFDTFEELEAGYTYALVVTVSENEKYNSLTIWCWFKLEAPLSGDKENAIVTFNFEKGDSFTKGADEKPEFTVSEGADYTYHFYCETKDLADEEAIFYSYEELEAGYSYSLVVTVNENDLYYANDGADWCWFKLEAAPVEGKQNAVVTFNFEKGDSFTKGSDEKPEFTISEGADYTYHFYCETKDQSFNTYEELEAGYSYSLVVTVNENDLYYANDGADWCWFKLEAAPVEGKQNAVVTFNFEKGDSFTKGADEKPEFTISEGADYTYHFYCEAKDQSFNTYEELEAGYSYSLVVTVNENDLYYANDGADWCWFNLVDASGETA